jgi:hypothetical protein
MKKVTTICARLTTPLLMPDNMIGRCQECLSKVQYRPHAPKGPKLCVNCAKDLLPDEIAIDVTSQKRMIADLQSYFGKQKQ